MNIEKWIRPERLFLFLSLLFGGCYITLNPPFQSPDEPNHFFRAWQISEGKFISEKTDQRVGGLLPQSLMKFNGCFAPVEHCSPCIKSSLADASAIKVESTQRVFIDFNNTALYSPICYLPQSMAIAIVRLFTDSVLILFYAARLASLLTWTFSLFICIRNLPAFKWLFTLFCLLPMAAYINCSISGDVMTNVVGLSFISTAICLSRNVAVTRWHVALLWLLALMLPFTKVVYAPIVLLAMIIPAKGVQRIYLQLLPIAITGVCMLYWSSVVRHQWISYEQYNPEFRDRAALVKNVDPDSQIVFIRKHKVVLPRMLKRSFIRFATYHETDMVAWIGWHGAKPPVPIAWIVFLGLVSVSVTSIGGLSWKERIGFLLVFLITMAAVFTSQFLTWTGKGVQVVNFIQSRYALPVYPLLLMTFSGIVTIKEKWTRVLVMSVSLLGLVAVTVLLWTLYH